MEPLDPDSLSVAGLRSALVRLHEADRVADRVASSVAVVECTTWITAVTEVRDPDALRDVDRSLLRAFRWARNRGVHQLIDLSTKADGLTFPVTFPARFEHLAWRTRDGLVVEGAHANQAKLEPDYDEQLAGRPVLYTIYRAADRLDVPAS